MYLSINPQSIRASSLGSSCGDRKRPWAPSTGWYNVTNAQVLCLDFTELQVMGRGSITGICASQKPYRNEFKPAYYLPGKVNQGQSVNFNNPLQVSRHRDNFSLQQAGRSLWPLEPAVSHQKSGKQQRGQPSNPQAVDSEALPGL